MVNDEIESLRLQGPAPLLQLLGSHATPWFGGQFREQLNRWQASAVGESVGVALVGDEVGEVVGVAVGAADGVRVKCAQAFGLASVVSSSSISSCVVTTLGWVSVETHSASSASQPHWWSG